ncbi:MAG: MoaD/ThiS family protein [Anaerolineales bacterium]|jgi:sulfur carrier protein ThiS
MSATLRLRDQRFEVRHGMTVRSAMLALVLEPDAYLATRDGELITDDEILREGEEIRLIAVISGGSGSSSEVWQ